MSVIRLYVLMKPLPGSKSRLAHSLGDDQRRLLSLAMLQRVLSAAAELPYVNTAVAGGDASVRELCRAIGVAWQDEPALGLNEALSALLEAAAPGELIAYLPADLPLLSARDVIELLALATKERIVLAPDRHKQGTNALVVPAGAGFRPLFGEGSFERHLSQARELGLQAAVCRAAGIRLDVDNEEDLEALLAAEPDFWTNARRVLEGLGVEPATQDAAANASLA